MTAGLYVVLAAYIVIFMWIFGSITFRLAGWLLLFTGFFQFVAAVNQANSAVPAAFSFVVFVLGAVLWLTGHWLYAAKRKEFRSRVAESILTRLGGRFDPTRNWAVPVYDVGGDP